MQYTLALVALATAAYAQECSTTSSNGRFQLNPVNITSSSTVRRSIHARQSSCDAPNALTIELNDGVLTDTQGRIGSIVANYQFQFDGPPAQAGALVTDGYSICGNNSLASNGNAVWYQCSDLTRTSIYGPDLSPIGDACYQVYYDVVPCSGATSGASVSALADGQPIVTAASSCVPVTTMSDGQPVVSSCPPTSTCVPITTMSDGQPVVQPCPTSSATSSCVPITTMSDGQPVVQSCPTAAPTSSCVPITTMADGQPVVVPCPTATASTSVPVLVEMGDGQVAATGGLAPTATPSSFMLVNAAPSLLAGSQLAAALVALVAVLFL